MNLPSPIRSVILAVRRRFNIIDLRVFGVTLAVLTAIIIWLMLASTYLTAEYDLAVGDVAPDSIEAPRSLTFEDRDQTEVQRQLAREEVADVYTFDASVLPRVNENIDEFFREAGAIIEEEKAAAAAASQPYDPNRAVFRIQQLEDLPQVELSTLLILASLEPPRIAEIRNDVLEAVQRILQGNVTEASLPTDRDRLNALVMTMPISETERNIVSGIGSVYLEPNYTLDEEKTSQAREEAAAQVEPVIISVINGETILAAGQVVTEDTLAKMEALGITENEGRLGTATGVALLVLIEVVFVALYVVRFERRIRESRALMFIVATLLIIFTLLDRISLMHPLTPLLVPMAALGILGTLMLQTRMGLILVALASINLVIAGGGDSQFVLVALLGGSISVFLVTDVTQRKNLFQAGLEAGAIVTLAAAAAGLLIDGSLNQFLEGMMWGAINGVLVIVTALGLLAVYEMTFNLSTPMKLLELADPTRPLLKDLMMQAPGTYNHSILMGNISESAAEAIGANPLLARVGAFYHDIGKLNRPEYFIENQFHVKNPHDRLTPGLSRLAITSHVRDGVELARAEGLPPEVIDIIEEHHGTTVLSYFYHKAQQTAPDGRVDEEAYRYAGKKPHSREAAIVMMADSVEAAVRSLKNPTVRNIKNIIGEIFEQRMRDGQFNESSMTFADLEKVRHVFEKSLQGFGASRIEYPGGEQGEDETGRDTGARRTETRSGSRP